jgi:protein-disulfide isomerase
MRRQLRIALALLASLVGSQSWAQEAPSTTADRARIRGSESAVVWLVIVGDFANEQNRAFQRDVWPLVDSLFIRPGRLRVAWVNLPDEASRQSQVAAEVAACSGTGMKFWPVHDIFLADPRWKALADPTAFLVNQASNRGGNAILISDCLKKHTVRGLLQADVARARAAGIRRAPGYVLDNSVLPSLRTAAEFRAAIERALPHGR